MFAFCLLIASAFAGFGVDVSQPTSSSSFTCLRNNGFNQFAIARAWCSPGYFDSNSPYTTQQAKAAGYSIENIDTYFYPCVSCGNPAGQVSSFWNSVIANRMEFKRVWFDVEGSWTSSYSSNQQFLMGLVEQARAIGIVHGIYSSKYYWGQIFGSYTFPYASSTPLWYAHYDNWASFGDFSSFGGWSSPSMKQYRGDVSICSAGVDYDWKP